jgi:trimeric autotransporter adhesin
MIRARPGPFRVSTAHSPWRTIISPATLLLLLMLVVAPGVTARERTVTARAQTEGHEAGYTSATLLPVTISGRITVPPGGVVAATVSLARNWDWPNVVASVAASDDGSFRISESVKPGQYELRIWQHRFYEETVALEVGGGQQDHRIDVPLIPWARVSGVVVDQDTGTPLPSASVSNAMTGGGEMVGPAGEWSVEHPFTSEHPVLLTFWAPEYAYQTLRETPCTGCPPQPLVLEKGEQRSGIVIALEKQGRIQGRVTSAGVPVRGSVALRNPAPHFSRTGILEDGTFEFAVAPGTYSLFTEVAYHTNQKYQGISCGAWCDSQPGTPLEVVSGQTVVVDFDLSPLYARGISGRVVDAATGQGIENVYVLATPTSVGFINGDLSALSDADGAYSILTDLEESSGWPIVLGAGSYSVRTMNAAGYGDQLWPGVACRGSCTSSRAEPIQLEPNELRSDVVFRLSRLHLSTVSPSSGPVHGGTPVTITGGGFLPGTVVTIGGEPAEILNIDPGNIQIVTPGGVAGFHDVVIAYDGATAIFEDGFRYNPSRKPEPYIVCDTALVAQNVYGPLGEIATLGNLAFFVADDELRGRELWRSDGTAFGTWLVRDIAPGRASSDPSFLTAGSSVVFFIARSQTELSGVDVWQTDGSSTGTRKVAGPFNQLLSLYAFGDTAYFTAHELQPSGSYRSGTWRARASGEVAYVTQSTIESRPVLLGDKVYFRGSHGLVSSILSGASSTFAVRQIFVLDGPILFQGRLYFSGVLPNDTTSGVELWVSDGTAGGTKMLVDLDPAMHGFHDPVSSAPRFFDVAGDRLVFAAMKNGRVGLWATDGTPGGTTVIHEPLLKLNRGVALGSNLIFAATDGRHGIELWRTNGRREGTALIADINPAGDSMPRWLTRLGSEVYFSARERPVDFECSCDHWELYETCGRPCSGELWKTDGTTAGTRMVKDIRPGPAGGAPYLIRSAEESLFFYANDGFAGLQLWKSDGSERGTAMVARVNRNHEPGQYFHELGALGDRLLFVDGDWGQNMRLRVTEGTSEKTKLLRDTPDPNESMGTTLTMVGDRGYFFIRENYRNTLWVTDGTVEGTRKEPDPALSGAEVGGTIIPFGGGIAYSVASPKPHWRLSTKVGESTALLEEIAPGTVYDDPVVAGDHLFFLLYLENGDKRLVKTKGGATVTVTDLPSSASDLKASGRFVYFFARSDLWISELWMSDGTAEGTTRVTEAERLIAGAEWVFFTRSGEEGLWRMRAGSTDAQELPLPYGYRVDPYVEPVAPLTDGEISYVVAPDGKGGSGLWRSDGTVDGTILLTPTFLSGGGASPPTKIDGLLYFGFLHPDTGFEPWISDGTPEGTMLLYDMNPYGSSGVRNFVRAGNLIYFVANDFRDGSWIEGGKLWAVPLEYVQLRRRATARR